MDAKNNPKLTSIPYRKCCSFDVNDLFDDDVSEEHDQDQTYTSLPLVKPNCKKSSFGNKGKVKWDKKQEFLDQLAVLQIRKQRSMNGEDNDQFSKRGSSTNSWCASSWNSKSKSQFFPKNMLKSENPSSKSSFNSGIKLTEAMDQDSKGKKKNFQVTEDIKFLLQKMVAMKDQEVDFKKSSFSDNKYVTVDDIDPAE